MNFNQNKRTHQQIQTPDDAPRTEFDQMSKKDVLTNIPKSVVVIDEKKNNKKKVKKTKKAKLLDDLIKPLEKKTGEPVWKSPYYDDKIIPNPPFRLLVSGPGTAGKTVLLTNLLARREFYRDYFTRVIVISPNVWNAEWEPVHEALGDRMISYDHFSAEVEKDIMDYYETNRDLVRDMGADLAPKFCVVWDDMVDDKNVKKSRLLHLLATRGRHQNFSQVYSAQFYNAFPLALRKQLTNVLQFGTPNEAEFRAIHAELGHRKLTKNQFLKLFESCTKGDHKFMHINMQVDPDRRYRRGFHFVFEIVGNPGMNRKDDDVIVEIK